MDIGQALSQFIPALIQAFFNFFMTVLVTVIQVITWPLNQLITAAFPSIATQITSVSTNLGSLLAFIPYILSFLPPGILALLLFMLGVEITLTYVFQSTFLVGKVWKIFQKIKFW
jgi:hypothetical protein